VSLAKKYLARITELDRRGPALLPLAFAFEQATPARRPPPFLPAMAPVL
jgi:hypothetical protein